MKPLLLLAAVLLLVVWRLRWRWEPLPLDPTFVVRRQPPPRVVTQELVDYLIGVGASDELVRFAQKHVRKPKLDPTDAAGDYGHLEW